MLAAMAGLSAFVVALAAAFGVEQDDAAQGGQTAQAIPAAGT